MSVEDSAPERPPGLHFVELGLSAAGASTTDTSSERPVLMEHQPVLVMLHPTPVDHRFWLPVSEMLGSGRRLLLPDLPGHGLSPLDETPASMATMARAVLRLLDALRIERAAFCGCSIGGYLLYELWRQAPERMTAMAIVSAKPHADSAAMREQRSKTIAGIREQGTGPFFQAMLASLVGAPAKQQRPEMLRELQAMMQGMSPEAAIAVQCALAERPDSLKTAASINIPAAVLAGSLDGGSTPPEMRELADAIPGAQFFLLHEMGHYAPYEQPRLVGSLLQRFFDASAA